MNIETATADELCRLLLGVQDQLTELVAVDRVTLTTDAEQEYGTARRAVWQAVRYPDAAHQVLAALETR